MKNLIERYVYDVTRRLPEKDRQEVSKELNSNILDMLPDGAGEEDIKHVLYELGAPASLANKYRQNPRYLISPDIYDDYIRILKLVLPLVGGLLLIIGLIIGVIDGIHDGMTDASAFISNMISNGISVGISAAYQALVWITIGFVIAERTDRKKKHKTDDWRIEDLPEVPVNDKGRIPLSESITALMMTIVFSIAAILICAGIFPAALILQSGNFETLSVFSPAFLMICIPVIIIMALCGIGESIIMIKIRRWTSLVCGAVIIKNLVHMGLMLFLITRPGMFSDDFYSFIQDTGWIHFEPIRFMGMGGPRVFMVFIAIVVVIGSLAGCCTAIYKTLKYKG